MDYINNIINWLKTNLDDERFEHSLGVADKAKELAEKFGEDSQKAYLAGLIHDCAKCLSKQDTEDILSNHIQIEECEKINRKTHHAPAGVYVAQKEFNVIDKSILDSIRWHTIGRLGMSDFEKIIFIADKIEPRTRPTEMINFIESELDKGLDYALLACYKLTIKSLVDRELKICINTIDLYNELLGRLND